MDLVGAPAALAVATIDHWVDKGLLVAGILPDQPIHQDGRVEALHIVALVYVGAPPILRDVVLQLDTQRAIVEDTLEPAVDLGAGIDEAAPLGQRNDLIQTCSRHGNLLLFGRRTKDQRRKYAVHRLRRSPGQQKTQAISLAWG